MQSVKRIAQGRSLMREAPIVRRFARNLRNRRLALGLSQEAFARKCKVDRTYVSGCERGVRNPTITVLAKLARVLKCKPYELLE